ncbi:MAG: DUF58 domain-containing protein [Dehalococcoidia bacterium]|nr:DUF58 domain-containing protein [Dehalococcoidia bacterium]
MRVLLVSLVAVFFGVLGLSTGVDHYFRLSYLLVLVLLAGWVWTHFSVSGITVNLRGSTTSATVGQKAWVQFTVFNDNLLPSVWAEVRQEADLPNPWPPHVLQIPSDASRTIRVDFECQRRGRFTVGPTHVASGDPFGLFRRQITLSGTHSLVVYPRTVDLTGFTLPPADLPGEGRHRRRTHFVTPNASGVRDYVYGDSFNRIHWPSTVRTGRLMVKEFELDPASETWIALDLHRDVQVGEDLESTEEYGATVAASIAHQYIESNRPIGFMSFGHYLDIHQPERSGHQLVEIMESLALAKAEGTVPIAELLAGEARRFGRYSTLLVVTSSTDEAWVYQLQHLIRRGARVAAVVIEGSTFGQAKDSLQVVSALLATGVQTFLVKQGGSISESLGVSETARSGARQERGTAAP